MVDQAERKSASVLRFRPRTSARPPGGRPVLHDEVESARADGPDDFRQRMVVNLAGLACAVTLTLAGIWLASTISDLRHTQDCVLSGRRDCAPIAAHAHLPAAVQH